MARVFVMAHPPRSKILHTYGDDFGDFIAAFRAGGANFPISPMSRGSKPRARAPITPPTPRRSTPADFGDDRAGGDRRACASTLHPSLEILRSRHPVVTIWSMNAGEAELAPIDETAPEDALVLRPHLDVTVRRLPPGGAAFIARACAKAQRSRDAAERAAGADPRFDLTGKSRGPDRLGRRHRIFRPIPKDRRP